MPRPPVPAGSLREFNLWWARRLPLLEATVLLVTDGLERAEIELLSAQAARLGRSCARFIWLNPLLRYETFEPKARGVRALLPHVDRLLPVHNVASLEQVARALAAARPGAAPHALGPAHGEAERTSQ